ncbi:MAG: transcriptional regulator FtrA [Gammaproteobacteria bacterium]|nr:transcriptional regulator FtrA [Gammaproteobacteria bacterium]
MRHKVVAIAYDGLCTFEFGCAVELFALPRPELAVPWYEFAVCAAEPGPLRAAGGLEVRAAQGLRVLERADTIVIPGWRSTEVPPPPPVLAALRRAARRGARLCSICSGVFVLAHAGLLDGRRATTHWRYGAALATRFPRVQVELNALYVDEGQILTSAGSAAGLDMLLHLVRRDFGPRIANQVAQRLVLPPHREGGQAQFVPRPVAADERGRLGRLLDFVRAHLAERHTLRGLAARAAMSTRTLQREFRAATGQAAYAWIVRERVARAKELLEGTRLSTPAIAARVGLGSAESLRHHFRAQVGTTPAAYRRRFELRAPSRHGGLTSQ